ncbi:MAG: hypothetical protein ACRDK7_03565 [Solirubrobacteraceae bacterium]
MSTSYFSKHEFGEDTPARAGAGALEPQQATLLELLRSAAGAPLSFADLNAAGIEFPASVVSELELAGVAIERCVLQTDGASEMGVRLDPSRDPHRAPADLARQSRAGFEPAAVYLRPSAGLVRRLLEGLSPRVVALRVIPSAARRTPRALRDALDRRWLAPLALLAALGLVIALVLIALPGSRPTSHARVHARPAKPAVSATAHVNAPTRAASRAQPPTPVSPALAAELQTSGHELLEAGRYAAAIQNLERAVTATGERLDDCLEPVSETCLTYAYALYDLGHALQLSGQPSAAVGILQRRLQIDNQRPVVQSELALARTQVG